MKKAKTMIFCFNFEIVMQAPEEANGFSNIEMSSYTNPFFEVKIQLSDAIVILILFFWA